ncbi:MAG TPA: hypothetical protein VFV55_02210 [Usitatibacteraceae bacterium]|nr:hypothetical protein [Usitatibacteraceae bacterium]
MKTLKILSAALLATFAVAAQAGPFGGPGTGYGPGPGAGVGPGAGFGPGGGYGHRGGAMLERLKAADTNSDGVISREEAQAALPGLAANFDAIDANKDGNITYAEMQAARGTFGPAGRGEGWKKWDVNGDGKLSRDEVANAPRLLERFDALDANHDGFLATEEMQAARLARGPGARGMGWTRLDADGDGKLSRAEVANAPRLSQEFDAIDADKDGFLTIEELQAAHSHFGGRGWGRHFRG